MAAAEDHPVSHVFDAVSENGSTIPLSQVLLKTSPNGKGKITVVLPINEEEIKRAPEGISISRTWVRTAQQENEACEYFELKAESLINFFALLVASRYYARASEWLQPHAGSPLRPNRVKLLPGGLESIRSGLELLQNGKVHAEKLVYRISETPGIVVAPRQ